MAYLSKPQTEEEQRKQEQQSVLQLSETGSSVPTTTSSADPVSTERPVTKPKFIPGQRYLQGNIGATQQLAEGIVKPIEEQQTAGEQTLKEQRERFLSSLYPDKERAPELTQKALERPTELTPEEEQKFISLRKGEYAGPTTRPEFQDVKEQEARMRSLAELMQTPGGLTQLIKPAPGKYTKGMGSFDAMLLRQSPDIRQRLSEQVQRAEALKQQRALAEEETTAGLSAAEQAALARGEDIIGQFQKRQDLEEAGWEQALETSRTGAEQRAAKLREAMQSRQELTPEQLKLSGLTLDEWDELRFGEAPTKWEWTPEGERKEATLRQQYEWERMSDVEKLDRLRELGILDQQPGTKGGDVTFVKGQPSAIPQQYRDVAPTEAVPDQPLYSHGLAPKGWEWFDYMDPYTQVGTREDIGLTDVVTPEQRAYYDAINKLSGLQDPNYDFRVFGNTPKTTDIFNYDKESALRALNEFKQAGNPPTGDAPLYALQPIVNAVTKTLPKAVNPTKDVNWLDPRDVTGTVVDTIADVSDKFDPTGLSGKIGDAVAEPIKKLARAPIDAVERVLCLAKGTPILMVDGNYKNVEDIKIGDKVSIGGEVYFTGKAKTEGVVHYKGQYMSKTHTVFEDGVWMRAKDSNLSIPVNGEEFVYPISVKGHILITPTFISADFDEIDNTNLYNFDETIKELNKQTRRNVQLKELEQVLSRGE